MDPSCSSPERSLDSVDISPTARRAARPTGEATLPTDALRPEANDRRLWLEMSSTLATTIATSSTTAPMVPISEPIGTAINAPRNPPAFFSASLSPVMPASRARAKCSSPSPATVRPPQPAMRRKRRGLRPLRIRATPTAISATGIANRPSPASRPKAPATKRPRMPASLK